MPGKPLLRASLMLPLATLLAACDNDTPPAADGPGTTAPKVAAPAAAQRGLPGIWRARTGGAAQALVLADDGQLYLVGNDARRGVRWQKERSDHLRLEYLDHDQGGARVDTLGIDLNGDTLTLEGEGPFAGTYRRDARGIDSVSGTVTLPAGVHLDRPAVLAVALVDLDAGDEAPAAIHRRLMRLPAGDTGDLNFHLYFSAGKRRPDHRYGVTARVIADGAVVLTTSAPRPLPADPRAPVTLSLNPPPPGD